MIQRRILIADDEPLARAGIRLRLQRHPDFVVAGEAASGRQALLAIRDLRPDVAFLDIHMPELDGIQVADLVRRPHGPLVVFITAYEQHALAAIQVDAVDYLVKPIDDRRFDEAIGRLRARLAAMSPEPDDRQLSTLAVRTGRDIVLLRTAEIDWLEARRDHVMVHVGPVSHRVRTSLDDLVRRLGTEFVRVHRSAAINRHAVVQLQSTQEGGARIVVRSGATVWASRRFRAAVRSLFKESPRETT